MVLVVFKQRKQMCRVHRYRRNGRVI